MKNFFKNYFKSYVPVTFSMLKTYSGKKFVSDLLAGLIVGIIALPLSIALAIASGAPPAVGLITAAVAGFVAALFAGSRYQITGPTGAFVVIVLGMIAEYTYEGLLIATFFAGIIILLMGLLKLGKLVDYIAKPIVAGFTAGIAVVIFSTQIVDFFSLQIASVPSEFIFKWVEYFKAIKTINFTAFAISAGCLIFMIVWQKLKIKVPGALIAVVLAAAIVVIFNLDVPTIGTKFGDISMDLKFSLPFKGLAIAPLLKPAVTIALLGSIESLLSAKAADNMTKTKTRNDMELVAQGLANIASSCVGGLPATGAIARTSANIKNGGYSPIGAIIHAIFILIVGLLLMDLVKFIPLGALAAVLVVVCINMIETKEIKKVFKSTISDMLLFVVTFLLTIIFDLVVAIIAGVALSFVLLAIRFLINKKSNKANSTQIKIENNAVKLSGSLNFFTAQSLKNKIVANENTTALNDISEVTIDAEQLENLDMSGHEELHNLKDSFEANKQRVVLKEPKYKINF